MVVDPIFIEIEKPQFNPVGQINFHGQVSNLGKRLRYNNITN